MNFWQNLKKPIMVLAPLADVTDPAFRCIIAKYGKPDVMWTEFVSADGLFLSPVREYCEKFLNKEITKKELEELSNGIGGSALIKDLAFTESERPIVAQFFTSKPEMMEKAAELACDLGFDGIDINMGCPDKSVEKQGSGAAHIRDFKHAQEIILATKRGVQRSMEKGQTQGETSQPRSTSALGRPVSVKTRVGYNNNQLEEWLPALLEVEPAVVTIHARTRKEMSNVPARWEHIKRAVEIRNNFVNSEGKKSQTLIFGNGDVTDTDDARKKCQETGCDGVMLGRAIFGNPWLFADSQELPLNASSSRTVLGIRDKLRVMVEHTKLFEELLPHKSFAIMKKHYKAYVTGWDGAKELRMKLMEAKDANEVENITTCFLFSL